MSRRFAFVLVLGLLLSASAALPSMEWFSLGTQEVPAGQDPRTVSFDLASAGIASARYLRIQDGGKGISVDAVVAERHGGSDGYADELVDFFAGDKGDAATMGGALGEPDYGSSRVAYAILGKNGWLTLDMGAREEIIDGPGNDFHLKCIGTGAIEVFASSGDARIEVRTIKMEATAFGSISIESSPNTIVYLDGKEIGKVPRWIDNVKAGQHDIELKHPQDTYLDRIDVEPNKVIKIKHSFLVEVPEVLRTSEKSAVERLEKLGFSVQVKYETDVEQLFGRVLRQSPKAGEKVDAGSAVEIIVNRESRN